ncbi:MAG: citrate/2-methylcitrate synthase [Planctomycetota bacterium]
MSGKGLEGVTAADSAICSINGEAGELRYRGYDIHELAEASSFEEVVFLLFDGELPGRAALEADTKRLARESAIPPSLIDQLRTIPSSVSPMAALRSAVSLLAHHDPDAESQDPIVRRQICERLVASVGTLVAAQYRLANGQDPISPDKSLGLAANFLYMLHGEPPKSAAAKAIDVALILHADHGFNASTFSARVTAATLSDVYSAVTSAVGTLKGPLHGGANEKVIDMLLQIDEEGIEPEAYIMRALEQGEKIMGFGHRVYRTEDPRATHLRRMSEALANAGDDRRWFDMSKKVEDTVREAKGLNCNVDFYSASTYYQLGLPTKLFTPLFAVSRMAGWTAHILEQLSDNRLIRPRANYIGPRPRPYVPASDR